MITAIRWQADEALHFLGRNGIGKCTGLEVYHFDDFVELQPFTSKDLLGRCHVRLPVAAIPKMIELLSSIDPGWGEPSPAIVEGTALGRPGRIDWTALVRQKQWLLPYAETNEEAAGLVELLDAIQDAAVQAGVPEAIVFPCPSEKDKKDGNVCRDDRQQRRPPERCRGRPAHARPFPLGRRRPGRHSQG